MKFQDMPYERIDFAKVQEEMGELIRELEAAKSELAVLKEKSTLSASSAQQAEKRNQTYQTLLSEKNAQVAAKENR